jgi:hypothetical protein
MQFKLVENLELSESEKFLMITSTLSLKFHKIQTEMTYPGQVTVIRETRAVNIAK